MGACGCSLPNSSLVMTTVESGCPTGCSKSPEYTEVLETAPCTEKTAQELKDDAAWKHYADTLVEIAKRSFWPSHHADLAEYFRSSMYELGCNVTTSPELRQIGWAPCSEDLVRT